MILVVGMVIVQARRKAVVDVIEFMDESEIVGYKSLLAKLKEHRIE